MFDVSNFKNTLAYYARPSDTAFSNSLSYKEIWSKFTRSFCNLDHFSAMGKILNNNKRA
jgi:hypothetical protein